ncbi:MAG: hypothetical protein KatS3mg103_0009 [Phycisphaerales bacterium]|nr:MAG: hypothetical protein KatS3mg103_0009 [Phycisphaerales bacterium]
MRMGLSCDHATDRPHDDRHGCGQDRAGWAGGYSSR